LKLKTEMRNFQLSWTAMGEPINYIKDLQEEIGDHLNKARVYA